MQSVRSALLQYFHSLSRWGNRCDVRMLQANYGFASYLGCGKVIAGEDGNQS